MNVNRRDALRVAGAGLAALAIENGSVSPALATSTISKNTVTLNRFPKPGQFSLSVQPLFRLTRDKKSAIVPCYGHLTIKTSEVFLNKQQQRQLDVAVVDWVAFGASPAVGGPFEFRFVPELSAAKSLQSFIVSVGETDFPATAHLVIPYEFTIHGASIKGLTLMNGLIRSLPPLPADVLEVRNLNDGELITSLLNSPEGKDPRIAVEAIACACS